MNIQRKEIELELNGEKYYAILDFAAAVDFESRTGKSITKEIQNLIKNESLLTLANIMASVIKKENNKCVGINFISELDLIDATNYFIGIMEQLIELGLPKAEPESEKKN